MLCVISFSRVCMEFKRKKKNDKERNGLNKKKTATTNRPMRTVFYGDHIINLFVDLHIEMAIHEKLDCSKLPSYMICVFFS